LAKIVSIATAVPQHKHEQQQILQFMEGAYGISDDEKRVLRYLYRHSGIDNRYSVIPDYTLPMEEWTFYPRVANLEPFPGIEKRMQLFQQVAPALSMEAANKCLDGQLSKDDLTHLITVTCTGLSAPGLEMQLMELMDLAPAINRSAVNFMGCYAAVHGLKQAADIVAAHPEAKVLVICTELCTLHFQKDYTPDAVMAPLLFGDGAAAVLITGDAGNQPGLQLHSFYAEVIRSARQAMSWELGAYGFNMTLSGYVPELIKEDFGPLHLRALAKAGVSKEEILSWCIHPGGTRILEALGNCLSLSKEDMAASYKVLKQYGNMSSATLLFVLKEMWDTLLTRKKTAVFGAAFGPGLTMESVIMKVV
jgi:predicted naringenin-chalcone synthase